MSNTVIEFISTALRLSIPLLIAALGLMFNSQAGVVNIGAEGMMLMGAFFAVVGSYGTGSAIAGALIGGLAGAATAAIFIFLVETANADETVVGTAINILGLGFTSAMTRIVFGIGTAAPKISSFGSLSIPLLSDIPVLGPILFQQSLVVYAGLALVPLCHIFLFKTHTGLRIRAVGEAPGACSTAGISVPFVHYATTIFGGFLCGIAGSAISLGQLSFFTEDMVAGRGFIALAALILGRRKPLGILLAVLLFGVGDALQFRIQTMGTQVPYQFLVMLPYLLTIVAVAITGRAKKRKARAADKAPQGGM